MKKIKLMFVSHSADLGGAEKVLLDVITNLSNAFEACLVVPRKGLLTEKAHQAGIPTFIVAYRYWLVSKPFTLKYFLYVMMDLVAAIKIKALIRKLDVDIVYTNTSTVIVGAIASKLSKKPHVWHIHESIGRRNGEFQNFFFSNKFVFKIINNLSVFIITTSDAVKKQFPSGCLDKVFTVYPGFNTGSYAIKDKDNDEIKKKYGIGVGLKVISLVGAISERKGQRETILAMSLVLKKNLNCVLIISGKCSESQKRYGETLSSIIQQHGLQKAVIFTGFKEDISEIYTMTDILIVPSETEPFGRVVVEAMLFGLPVIANKVGGIPEIIKNGINGVLINSRQPQDIADAIIGLLGSPDNVRDYAREGKRLAEERFGMDKMIAGIERVIRKIR